jgi:hypothetical protein
MVHGYAGALGWEPPDLAARSAATVALLFLAIAPVRIMASVQPAQRFAWVRRALLLAWTACFVLPAWKHGVVRWYFHYLAICLTFFTVMAFAQDALPCQRPGVRLWSRLLAVCCGLITLVALQVLGFKGLPLSLAQPFAAMSYSSSVLVNPRRYELKMNAIAERNRRGAELPKLRQLIGTNAVDVFGSRQAYAIFNGLNYRPRPLPQSYACGSAALMRLNEQFYLSEAAPVYVLFELGSSDRKFPSMQDAWV